MTTICLVLLWLSLFGLASVFFLYPLALWSIAVFTRTRAMPEGARLPSVSLLVVVRNGARLIHAKIENALAIDYPAELFELVVFSDGSTDDTEAIVERYRGGRVRLLRSTEHVGKATGINRSISSCRGDIIVFSDADALLGAGAMRYLVSAFSDPSTGGVCGQRVIGKDPAALVDAQRRYIRFDSWIKALESRVGSISSNDGKIYAIRKDLFQPIEQAVTDDLFACLSVVKQHRRFVFEPRAVAHIRVPSRDQQHELHRRRRIVARGLRGIYLMRELLNPMRYGFYSVSLFINKVVRRALSFLLALLLLASLYLAPIYRAAYVLSLLELAFLAFAAAYPVLRRVGLRRLEPLSSTCYYFCLGNLGSLLGVIDFLLGKQIVLWNPVKDDLRRER